MSKLFSWICFLFGVLHMVIGVFVADRSHEFVHGALYMFIALALSKIGRMEEP